MFETKNFSPRQLAAICAAIVAGLLAGALLFLGIEWKSAVLCAGGFFLLVYFLVFATLQRFIYRKIKVIYKLISQTKATPREEYFNKNVLPQKTIDEAALDAQDWASRRVNEIEVLQQNEKFRKEFLMNLAHELRTPIFTVQGYVETLLGGALEDAGVNRTFLGRASKSIDRLADLVNDLDEISKLESGQMPMHREAFSIGELVREVYEELTLQSAEKDIVMELKKGTERGLMVLADKPKIRQVLVNLVENGIKYCKEGATVSTGCYGMDDKHVYVEVSDDGPGISEAHLPRIFERFYRADRSRSREVGGTGLGLAIVKHIVEAHGQSVTVRSTPGVGSSFGFTLPRG